MGITTTIKTRDKLPVATAFGYETVASVLFDTDYASSGGEALTAATLGIPSGYTIAHATAVADGGAAFSFVYDITNAKLIAYVITTGVEAAAGLNGLDAIVCKLHVIATLT